MKKRVVVLGVVILIGLVGFVVANMIETREFTSGGKLYNIEVRINKGWNIVSGLISPDENLLENSEIKREDIRAVWHYSPKQKKYIRIYPDLDTEGYLKEDLPYQGPIINAMWIYSDKEGVLKYSTKYPKLEERNLISGWNFVSLTPEFKMNGLGNIKGDCNFEKYAFWNYLDQKWNLITQEVLSEWGYTMDTAIVADSDSDIGRGFIVKVSSDCNLGSSGGGVSPPSLPGNDVRPSGDESTKKFPYCTDSDGGLDYYTSGKATFNDVIILDEAKYPHLLTVNSNKEANLKFKLYDGIVMLGETYDSIDKDQTYTDDTQNILREVPTTFIIKSINYFGIGDGRNNIEIEYTTINSDECISKYGGDSEGLIEGSCIGQLDEFYRCPNGCQDGACI